MKMKQGIYAMVALAGMALMGVQGAFADTTVVYKMTSRDGSGTQTIYYRDKQHVRMDMANGAAGNSMTMLKLGDKVYMINGKTVQDLDQLKQMMAMMGRGGSSHRSSADPIRYEDTGRTETIAGLTGKVYRFKDRDRMDRGKWHEAVLAKNKDLQNAVVASVQMFAVMPAGMGGSSPSNRVQEDASIKSVALLRMDHVLRLQSMRNHRISNSKFTLPAKPQQLGGLGGALNGLLGH